ncbi:MAG: AAA family ATPase [Candidatus Thiodiazotropha sp. 6PLUC9]
MSKLLFKSIEVEQFRQFRSSVTVHDLTSELNVIAGSNEAGKSTLLLAVRAALFDRYKSSVGESFRPYGAKVSPKVCLVFELDGVEYRLTKVFSRRRDGEAALVASDGHRWEGPAAEDFLAELLGFSYAGRGGSRPEFQGLAGLLWVEQAKAYERVILTDQSREQVHGVFEEEMRELLGGGQGEALHRRITTLQGEYFTSRDKPRGDYQRLIEREVELKRRLQDKQGELEEYEEKVDHLEQKQAVLRAYREDRTLEKAEERVKSAKAADARLAELRTQVQAGTDKLGRKEAELGGVKQAFDNRNKLISELNEAQESVRAAERALTGKEGELKVLNQRRTELKKGLDELNARKQQKDAELSLARDAETLRNLVADHDRLLGIFKDARDADSERRGCASERDAICVTEKAVSELKKIERARDLANERLNAAATCIEHRLHAGAAALLGDQPLSGDGSVMLTQRTELQVDGVGQFSIIPGGEDLDVLRRNVESKSQQLAQALSDVDADSVTSAETSLNQKNDFNSQAAQYAATLRGLAPEGLPVLEDQVSAIKAKMESLQQKLGDNANKEFDVGNLEEEVQSLQDQVAEIESDVIDEDKVLQKHREALAGLRAEKTSAERLAEGRATGLEQSRGETADDQLRKDVQDAVQQVNVCVQLLEEAKQALNSENPEAVEIEVERSNRALDDIRQEIEALDRDVRDLKVELSAIGQKGLAEEVASFETEYAFAAMQLENASRRARALALLQRALDDALRQAKESVAQPVTAKLVPYLRQLIPGAEPTVNEDLILTGIKRDGAKEDFDDLSIGTREQLAVLVRLAYADLLSEAGVPVSVVLDDALVNSDDERRDRMKAILYQAAKRYQVLILTCHGREYRDTGGTFIRLEERVERSENEESLVQDKQHAVMDEIME